MLFIVYNVEDYKCRFVEALKSTDVILEHNEDIKEFKGFDISQSDIRAYNNDWTVKSLRQQIDEGIVTLADDEVMTSEYTIEKANLNRTEDKIDLIKRGIIELDEKEKIVVDDNQKETIVQKSTKELYEEKLITSEEYNEKHIIPMRKGKYSELSDPIREKLLSKMLSKYIEETDNEEEKELYNQWLTKRQNIKKMFKKEN